MSNFRFSNVETMMKEYELINHVFRLLKNRVQNGNNNEILFGGDHLAQTFLGPETDYIDAFRVIKKFSFAIKSNGNFYIEGINQKIFSVSLSDELLCDVLKEENNFRPLI